MNAKKILFFVSTGLLSLMMLFSAGMYIFNNAEISKLFEKLGHPGYIPYPLAALKLLGLAAIWSNYSAKLKEWAYAGFFFNFVLAFSAHMAIGDGEFAPSLAALTFLIISYVTDFRSESTESA